MRYELAIDYLMTQLPMYQRRGKSAYKPGLDRIIGLLDQLGHPQFDYPTIHVAGTNGKGSVSHMLAAGLQAKGLRVGLYTSPHYSDYRERIKINGEMIDKPWLAAWVAQIKDMQKTVQPSFFEMSVAMAFDYFKQQNVDIAVIETGLGGRLDSTNVLTPILSVITNIGMDHMDILGDTRPQIAYEKAGIIKHKTPVVIGERDPETEPVFQEKAASMEAPIIWSQPDMLHYKGNPDEGSRLYSTVYRGRKLKLLLNAGGSYQDQNLATTLCAFQALSAQYSPTATALKKGLARLKQLTAYKGRYEILHKNPLVLADAAHNTHGIQQLLASLKHWPWVDTIIILGMVSTKDHDDILSLLPRKAFYFFVKPDVPRGLSAHMLMQLASQYQLEGNVYPSTQAALQDAKRYHKITHVLVTGSSFVVAEVV